MKALLINGSPNSHGCTYTALCEVKKTLESRNVETEIFQIGKAPVAGCISCGTCRTAGKCVFDDAVNELSERLDEFDAVIVGSPVYYSGPSGQLISFLDRLFYSAGRKMQGKVAAAIVSCRRGGASAAFEQINKFFGIANMIIVTSQYWNQIHGNTPKEVLQDAEGLQTMRTLGENAAFVLQCLDAGKKAGVTPPQYEKPQKTNFIR